MEMKPSQLKNTPKLQIRASCIRTNKDKGEKNDGKRRELKRRKKTFLPCPNTEKEGVITARGSASMAVLERGGPRWITPSSVRVSLVTLAVKVAPAVLLGIAALVALP